MAEETDINKVIDSLKEFIKTGGPRKPAAEMARKSLEDSKKLNKATKDELRLKIDAYRQAQRQFKKSDDEYELLEKRIKVTQELIKANEEYVDTIRKVGNSFVGLGKAAFEGEGSISAFTDNVKGLGFIGRRLDVNIETFRQLSQTGANFGQSIVELRQSAAAAALPLDDFAKLIGENAQAIAAMFGSATQGAKAIANLGRQTRELGIDRLAPLGFTVDEINETLLLNLDNQRRAGMLDRLTDTQRIDSSIAFAEQLDRLAKLTGQQRDELRKQIEQQQANERFQAFLQGQTVETGNRLRSFAGTVAGISPELAEGFQDLIANAGVPVTDAALALVQNIPGARAVINDLISGVVSSEQALVRIRDISASSIDRFRKATVTGQVEFLRLQGGIIELGRRVTDTGAVTDEQNAKVSSLVGNLTTFEQASKVLSSQFQSIETGLLQAFGPALGGLIGNIQGLFSKAGALATAMAKAPALTAGLIVSGLVGKFLFNKAVQIGVIAAGTRMGTAHMATRGLGAQAIAGKGLRGAGMVAGGLGLTAAGTGIAATAESGVGKAAGVGMGIAGGAMTGAQLGLMFGPGGAMIGGIAGGLIGGGAALLGMGANKTDKKAFGGPMDAGNLTLVGEGGPELVTAGTASTVTSNTDLAKLFNTEALETKMTSMVTELTAANKTLTSMVNGVNTLVAVEGRAMKAVEITARKDRNQVGLV